MRIVMRGKESVSSRLLELSPDQPAKPPSTESLFLTGGEKRGRVSRNFLWRVSGAAFAEG